MKRMTMYDLMHKGTDTVEEIGVSCYNMIDNSTEKIWDDLFYRPQVHYSRDFKTWIAVLDIKTCLICRNLHGKIYLIDEIPEIEPKIHENCRCVIDKMQAAYDWFCNK